MLMQDQVTGQIQEVPDYGFYAEDLVSGYGEPEIAYMAGDPYGYFGQPEVGYYGEEPVGYYGEEPLGVVYDGLGNPLGFSWRSAWRGIRRIAKTALPIAQQFLPPQYRALLPLVKAGLPGVVRALPGMVQQFVPQAAPYVQAAAAALDPGAAPPGAAPPTPGAPAEEGAVEGWGWGEAPPMQVGPYRSPPPGWVPRPRPYMGQRPRAHYMRCLVWKGPRGLVPRWAATPQPGVPAPPPGVPVPGAAPVPVPVPGFTRPPVPPRPWPPRRPVQYVPAQRGMPNVQRRP
jgi:hypothetical protein